MQSKKTLNSYHIQHCKFDCCSFVVAMGIIIQKMARSTYPEKKHHLAQVYYIGVMATFKHVAALKNHKAVHQQQL